MSIQRHGDRTSYKFQIILMNFENFLYFCIVNTSERTPLISVIIPAYNAEKYLAECLESVKNQTFSDFEVIIVNDASTDSTAEIAQSFAAQDPRFNLLHLSHTMGPSASRNAGVEKASGEYLVFQDSDDCLYPQALEFMVKTLSDCDVEIARIDFVRKSIFSPEVFNEISPVVFDISQALELTLFQKNKMNSICGMLIRKDFVVKAGGFREGIWYEDLDAFYRFFEQADRIAFIPLPLYFYRLNLESFITTWSPGRLDVLDVTDRIVNHFKTHHPELLHAALDRRFSAHFNILTLLLKYKIDDPTNLNRCLSVIKEGRKRALTDPKVRFKNKIGALASFGGLPTLKVLSRLFADR